MRRTGVRATSSRSRTRADPYPKQAALIQQNLEPIGITLDVKPFERGTMYTKCYELTTQIGHLPGPAWGKDYPDAYTFGVPLFGSARCSRSTAHLGLGATPSTSRSTATR